MADILQNALTQIDQAIPILEPQYPNREIFQRIIKKLKTVNNLIEGEIEITLDNGKKQKFAAYRSQHNDARGPYKGGLRFHPQVCATEVKALSIWMTWKCAITNLPYGGGKGGIAVDPKTLSQEELQRLARAYVRFLSKNIGPWQDVPAPDVNTNAQIMSWMVDEMIKIKKEEGNLNQNYLATFTGKPLNLGGSQGRDEATGLGGCYVLRSFAKAKQMQPNETKIAVQGFGNVGSWFARHAAKMGFKVVALCDSKTAIYNFEGLDVEKVAAGKKEYGSLAALVEKKIINAQILPATTDLLYLPVDILVPAALENVITAENAAQIKAPIIFEMANGPTTPEAEEILQKNKVLVIPDVLANAGGVSTSYFEWVQNLQGYYWSKTEVLSKLEPLMESSFTDVWQMYTANKNISVRQAAYIIAMKKVIDVMIARGE
ncbi:MAG: Glu/Leu/Phe/Val dehydrogenase [bacterium]|nr:Glu/Leu/Phe/Val dehydrogenase [bacterium]